MKIAVLTYSHESNCGAVLQAWALKVLLEQFGNHIDLPVVKGYETRGRLYNVFMSLDEGWYSFLKTIIYQFFTLGIKEWVEYRFKRSIRKLYPKCRITSDELSRYDLVIIGSDQVWNPKMGEYKLPLYLGECIPQNVPLVGYAVSAGDAVHKREWDKRVALAVDRFRKIYVRESMTADFIFRASGERCMQVLDPTLLFPFERYRELEEGEVPSEPYVFFYILGTNDVAKMVDAFLRTLDVKRAVFFDGSVDFVPHRKPSGYRRVISPGEMIKFVRHSVAIVACSFHGTAFALLSGKPFVSLTTRGIDDKFNTRVGGLLKNIGCEDRLFSVTEHVDEMCRSIMRPIASKVEEKLRQFRKRSRDLLRQAIIEAEAKK